MGWADRQDDVDGYVIEIERRQGPATTVTDTGERLDLTHADTDAERPNAHLVRPGLITGLELVRETHVVIGDDDMISLGADRASRPGSFWQRLEGAGQHRAAAHEPL